MYKIANICNVFCVISETIILTKNDIKTNCGSYRDLSVQFGICITIIRGWESETMVILHLNSENASAVEQLYILV